MIDDTPATSSLDSAMARQDRLRRVKQVADGVWHLDTFFLPNSINAYLIYRTLHPTPAPAT